MRSEKLALAMGIRFDYACQVSWPSNVVRLESLTKQIPSEQHFDHLNLQKFVFTNIFF